MPTSNGKARLIIVSGLPGSGKTTLAKQLQTSLHAIRLAPDEWMDALAFDIYDEASRAKVETLQWNLGQELLRLGVVVIIEWGTWSRTERDQLRVTARTLGAAVELRYVSAPPETLFERIQARNRERPPITRDDLERWVQVFEEPTDEELALFDQPASDTAPTS
ncbi:MAG: AAA family ATPase [Vicinamibacterales bacterium]